MRVNVDQHRCVGAGQCALYAPEIFAQNDEGLVEQLRQPLSAEDREAVEAAVMACPTATIQLSSE